MKKNFFTLIAFLSIMLICLTVTACSSSTTIQAAQLEEIRSTLTEEESYQLDLALKCKKSDDIVDILEKNNSTNFQVALATLGDGTIQEGMVKYNGLCAEALVVICANPKSPNTRLIGTRDNFTASIKNATLTPDQEIAILNSNDYTFQTAILARENISPEALIQFLKLNINRNPFTGGPVNIRAQVIENRIKEVILQVPLTLEQKNELLQLDLSFVKDALLDKEI